MPDDSTPEFKASQRKHSDKLSFERGLMDATGMTRTQVRQSLKAGIRAVDGRIAARPANAQVQIGPVPGVTSPSTIVDPQRRDPAPVRFDPQPFTTEPTTARDPGSSDPPAGDTVNFSAIQNGVLVYIQTPATVIIAE